MSTPGFRRYTYQSVPGRSVWLSRDPLEEDEYINIYCVVANNIINDVDYLGLLKVRFEITKGVVVGGIWGNPSDCSSGESLIDDWRASSLISVWSHPPRKGSLLARLFHNDTPGSCNTVNGEYNFSGPSAHAGEIRGFISDLCPGDYKVTLHYTVHLWVEADKGDARGKINGPKGKIVWEGSGKPNKSAWEVQKSVTVDVQIKSKSQEIMVIDYIPTLEWTESQKLRKSHAFGDLWIYPSDVKKVDK